MGGGGEGSQRNVQVSSESSASSGAVLLSCSLNLVGDF